MTDDPCDDITANDAFDHPAWSRRGCLMALVIDHNVVEMRRIDSKYNARVARCVADAWVQGA